MIEFKQPRFSPSHADWTELGWIYIYLLKTDTNLRSEANVRSVGVDICFVLFLNEVFILQLWNYKQSPKPPKPDPDSPNDLHHLALCSSTYQMTNGQYRSTSQYVPAIVTTIGSSSAACVSSTPVGSGGGGDYGAMAAAFGAAGGGGGGGPGHTPAAGAAPAAPSMTYNNSLQDLQSASYGMAIGKSIS